MVLFVLKGHPHGLELFDMELQEYHRLVFLDITQHIDHQACLGYQLEHNLTLEDLLQKL